MKSFQDYEYGKYLPETLKSFLIEKIHPKLNDEKLFETLLIWFEITDDEKYKIVDRLRKVLAEYNDKENGFYYDPVKGVYYEYLKNKLNK